MKKPLSSLMGSLLGIVAIPFVFLPHPSLAQTSSEIKLVTGNEIGEYYSIGKDIEKLGEKHNLDIDVIPTKGALQNINDVFNYESIALGIVQGDVLAFLNIFANDDEQISIKAESLRNVLPLFKEQIHVIAHKEIKSLKDLVGKRVSIGEEGSGTSLTASILLYQLSINPQELVTYDIKRGIHELRNGNIDALFYVAGVPSKVLQEQILPEDNFHLLPVMLTISPEDEFYSTLYSPVTLPANTYPWQTEKVETLAIQSFLFTVENDDCTQVNVVASLIKDNLTWLQANGNPIWKQVDLKPLNSKELTRMSKCVKP
ncbi:TAXI family TRAP transporter solute-binding subunit [Geminocystis sp. GBBB08]|uniref:TAXI family TRAP transporter solute-binding subunit n=1 Tax=Geminocystis sp. GBBB08 TaxID=2604140 RepID=UPI0027E3161D|nr:TAXI family TRAP transporter solute-binding subunit [Geminocystis sp. GBBB08]MBL1211210.1 TAXI family TRAP transporter solute-binding subunit [Geminocystis sp. GBBB08]